MYFSTVDSVVVGLEEMGYITDRSLATAIFLGLRLRRPLFLEGEAGVGKTEVGKVLSKLLDRELIRLQCYEGLDTSTAVYEWNYSGQMIEIRLSEAVGICDKEVLSTDIFSERFLIRRPLLRALSVRSLLLIDELDRADEAFEAYLLEILSDFQVTIPELGTMKAQDPPVVIITSNRTREVHDALKRRCFYVWIDYPSVERERKIVRWKVPGLGERLSLQVVDFVQKLRGIDLFKSPGVAETLDWSQALLELDQVELTVEAINDTLSTLLKYQDDIAKVQGTEVGRLLEEVRSRS